MTHTLLYKEDAVIAIMDGRAYWANKLPIGLVPNSCALVNPDLVIHSISTFCAAKLRINESRTKRISILFIIPSVSNFDKVKVTDKRE